MGSSYQYQPPRPQAHHHSYPPQRPVAAGTRRNRWLVTSFGCCASNQHDDDDEDETQLRSEAAGTREFAGICHEQPPLTPAPVAASMELPRPSTSYSMGQHLSHWANTSREMLTKASSRASGATFARPRSSYSKSRPSIGAPMDFRRVELGLSEVEEEPPVPVVRRRSFRPLELSIYAPEGVGRLSPLPDFDTDAWSQVPTALNFPAPAHLKHTRGDSHSSTASFTIRRKPLSNRDSILSTASSRRSRASADIAVPPSVLVNTEPASSRPQHRLSSSSDTPVSPSNLLPHGSSSSPARSRANTEPGTPSALQKRSSLRRTRTDVDDAICELNTIVEEKRADAYKASNTATSHESAESPQTPTYSHHVPAIAPSLRVHARSETLSDIGSAFSVPLSSVPIPTPPVTGPFRPAHSSLARLKTAMSPNLSTSPDSNSPFTPDTPVPGPISTTISKFSLWLRRSVAHDSTPDLIASSSLSVPTPPLPARSAPVTPSYSPHIPASSVPQSEAQTKPKHRPHHRPAHLNLSDPATRLHPLQNCPITPATATTAATPTSQATAAPTIRPIRRTNTDDSASSASTSHDDAMPTVRSPARPTSKSSSTASTTPDLSFSENDVETDAATIGEESEDEEGETAKAFSRIRMRMVGAERRVRGAPTRQGELGPDHHWIRMDEKDLEAGVGMGVAF